VYTKQVTAEFNAMRYAFYACDMQGILTGNGAGIRAANA
jgi:hypothetical protein